MFAFQAATFILPTAFESTVVTHSNCDCGVLDSSHFATFSEWYKTDNNNGIAQEHSLVGEPMVIEEDDDELDELIELMASLSLSEDDNIMEDEDELEASMNDLVERMAELSTPDSEMDDKDEMQLDLPEIVWMDDKNEMDADLPEVYWVEVDCDEMEVDGP
ncbi:MAG: hypothetical protein SGBAC_011270 [Bacillariaceae sp.]